MEIHTVFIVPYRDRATHKTLFMRYFEHIQAEAPEWARGVKLLFVHQKDNRQFNRGAMKNIGAIYVRRSFPQNWKDINLVFHDVDTLPKRHIHFSYATTPGVVAHYYGTRGILGGIVVIKACDFIAVGGFPNIWGWGYEDNALHKRVKRHGLTVDCSDFIDLYDFASVCRLDMHAHIKTISRRDLNLFSRGKCDYIWHIRGLRMEENGYMLDVTSFDTHYSHQTDYHNAVLSNNARKAWRTVPTNRYV